MSVLGQVPCDLGFATSVPDTLDIFGTQISFIPLPAGVQLTAFESSTDLKPCGIQDDMIYCVKDSAKSAAVTCDVVLRVEHDRELIEAIAEDLKLKLTTLGFEVSVWLLHKPNHKYAYAYIRALERPREQRRNLPIRK